MSDVLPRMHAALLWEACSVVMACSVLLKLNCFPLTASGDCLQKLAATVMNSNSRSMLECIFMIGVTHRVLSCLPLADGDGMRDGQRGHEC